MSVMAGCKSIYQGCNSVLERDACSKFHEVSCILSNQTTATDCCVPGNYYSFANTHETDARLFFTQGCVPVESDGSTPGEDSKVEQPEPPIKAPRATGGKGRPRGKQKAGGSKSS